MAISLHDALSGCSQGRGSGTDTLEAKLGQHMIENFHKPLFQVLFDVKKACNSLDQTRYMEMLRGYGIGENLQRLLKRFWEGPMVVLRSGSFYVLLFKREWGVTQGIPVSPNIFNMVVDAVVRDTMMKVCGPQEEHRVMGWAVGGKDIVFYAYDGRIAGIK